MAMACEMANQERAPLFYPLPSPHRHLTREASLCQCMDVVRLDAVIRVLDLCQRPGSRDHRRDRRVRQDELQRRRL